MAFELNLEGWRRLSEIVDVLGEAGRICISFFFFFNHQDQFYRASVCQDSVCYGLYL